MRLSTSIPTLAMALVTSISVATCGGSEPSGSSATATVSGVVSAAAGPVIEGASVTIGSALSVIRQGLRPEGEYGKDKREEQRPEDPAAGGSVNGGAASGGWRAGSCG